MKKICLLAVSFLVLHSVNAQVVYSEDFENFTIGNVGTDVSGQTAGQGGWFTYSSLAQVAPILVNDAFQIQNEPPKGKVITMVAKHYPPPYVSPSLILMKDIDTEIANRTAGNDVIKLEGDFYTAQPDTTSIINRLSFGLYRDFNFYPTAGLGRRQIADFEFDSNTGELIGWHYYERDSIQNGRRHNLGDNNQPLRLPFNEWFSFSITIDYPNNKVIFEIPSWTYVEHTFDENKTYPNNMNGNIPETFVAYVSSMYAHAVYKFDNIKVTALKSLSTKDVLSHQFNLYPNPAADRVTVTNSENIGIEELTVYDMNGKTVKVQPCENENEVVLNMESLSSGSYLLHIKTKEGTAIKKLIKK